MVPAQRLDLELSGVDDGLNSFGQGIWMFHDHVEKSFTTNGHGEGGDISLVVYKGFVDDKGIPSAHGMSLAPYFAKSLWQGKYPIWQDYDAFRSLGLPDLQAEVKPLKVAVQTPPVKASEAALAAQQQGTSAIEKLFYGIVMGLLGYTIVVKRRPIIDFALKLIDFIRSKLVKK
jgi:hypothetical protein